MGARPVAAGRQGQYPVDMWVKASVAAILVFGSMGCRETFQVQALEPEPNVVAQHQIRGTYEIELQDVSDEERCSTPGGLRWVCVSKLRTAYERGLKRVMQHFASPGPDHQLVARFRMLSFGHSLTDVGGTTDTVKFTMRWQSTLTDGSSEVLVGLAETIASPVDAVGNRASMATAVTALNNAVLDRIAAELNTALRSAELKPDAVIDSSR